MKQTIYGWALTVGELKRLLEAHDSDTPVVVEYDSQRVPLQPGPNMSIAVPMGSEPLLSFDVDDMREESRLRALSQSQGRILRPVKRR